MKVKTEHATGPGWFYESCFAIILLVLLLVSIRHASEYEKKVMATVLELVDFNCFSLLVFIYA